METHHFWHYLHHLLMRQTMRKVMQRKPAMTMIRAKEKALRSMKKKPCKRVSQKKAKELDAVVKRPASKKAFAKVKASPKSKVQKQEKMKHTTPAFDKGIFGCVGCRGNTMGCSHHFLVESGSAPGKSTTNGTRRSSRVKKGSENISFQSCNLDKGFGVQYGKKPYHAKTLHGGHMQW